MITDPLFYAAALPAIFFMGLSKGGFAGLSALMLPLMALVISPVQAAAITLPILLAQDVVSVWAYRKSFDTRNTAILLAGGLVGIAAGYVFAAQVSDAMVRLAVGAIALAFGAQRLIQGTRARTTSADIPRGIFWGSLTGFASFIAHSGGPPFQVYVMPQRLPREVFAGTSAIVFAAINLLKVPPYVALGQFTAVNLMTAVVLMPFAVLSTLAGVAIVRRFSSDRFYTLVYLLLVAVGLKLVYDGWAGLTAGG